MGGSLEHGGGIRTLTFILPEQLLKQLTTVLTTEPAEQLSCPRGGYSLVGSNNNQSHILWEDVTQQLRIMSLIRKVMEDWPEGGVVRGKLKEAQDPREGEGQDGWKGR